MNTGHADFFGTGVWDLTKIANSEAFPFNFATAFSGVNVNTLNFFHYFGSKTTPNCEEVVNWFVISDPFKIKDTDLFTLSGLFSDPTKFPYGNLRVL